MAASLRLALLVLAAPALSASAQCDDGSCAAHTDEESLIQLRGAPVLEAGVSGDVACEMPTEECVIKDGHDCSLAHMRFDKFHAVYPGGRTACLNSSAPYFFLVKKGNPTKLMLLFEDGGVCYDWASFNHPVDTCIKQPRVNPWAGVMNFSSSENPYSHYTMVRIMYCSGDVHGGNTEQNWGPNNETVKIRGYDNADAAVAWASAQFPLLRKLVVAGYSAGALGVLYWADHILRKFADRQPSTVVHLDSGHGILFPTQGLQQIYQQINYVWNTCDNDALRAEVKASCKAGTLTWQQHWADTMTWHGKASFTAIVTKADWVQVFFAGKFVPGGVTFEKWYYESVLLMKAIAEKQPDNFRAYFLDGNFHGFLNRPEFYTATPLGEAGGATDEPTLRAWVSSFPTCSQHGMPGHVCVGDSASVTRSGAPPDSLTYCDSTFLPVA